MKGEQFFHVAKAMLCDDLASALKMMVTTGGPALRGLGRQVLNYQELGSSWEKVDTGLLLLVNITIKLAQVQNISADSNAATRQLHNELRDDGLEGLYIVEGARGDDRCGIGIHAEDPSVFNQIDCWGRNQLGHACMVIARHLGNESSGRDEVSASDWEAKAQLVQFPFAVFVRALVSCSQLLVLSVMALVALTIEVPISFSKYFSHSRSQG